MDKRIERSLEENVGITEEFEEFSKECFERIFDMLGKKNFERWIDKRKLAPRIKQLIVESMEEKDKRDNPHWGGYYTRGTNRIRLGEISKDIATHEKFHFMTDNGENFSTFIDEGLTEYLKSMVEGKISAYPENVATVKYLHHIYGDSIIKAYLLGNTSVFNNKISSSLAEGNETNQSYERKRVERFYENLDLFHKYNSAESKYHQALRAKENEYSETELAQMEEEVYEAKKEYGKVELDIIAMLQEIAIKKVSKMAKNFEFYQNGTLDVILINKTITEILRTNAIKLFYK